MTQQTQVMSYDEFERDWLRKHRSSIPRRRRVSTARSWFWVLFWIVVASGAAIYSAAHTIPAAELTILRDVPNRSALAISVFAIVELVIFGAAAKRHDVHWLRYLMMAATLVALVSNVGSSVLAVSENGGNVLNQIAGVLLSILAPVTALAAGEVLHKEQDKRDAAQQKVDDEYQVAMVDLQTKVNAAWKRYEKDSQTSFGHTRTAEGRTDNRALSDERPSYRTSDNLTSRTSFGHTRTADGLNKVLEWFTANPDQVRRSVRDLEQEIGVGRDTISRARRQWLKQQQSAFDAARMPVVSTNGNGNGHAHMDGDA
jgi:hypothetical protein